MVLCAVMLAATALLMSVKTYGLSDIAEFIYSVRLLSALKKRLKAWLFLFSGPDIIQQGYDNAKGQPFEILTPDTRYIFVSSQKHIREIDSAPYTVLSLQAASRQYTMHGFNWFDRRGAEGVGSVRALRTLLTNNPRRILPDLRVAIAEDFARSRHSPFMNSAFQYIEETLKTAEIIRLLPRVIAPIVGHVLAKRLSSNKTMYNALLPVAEQRLQEKAVEQQGQKVEKHNDCIQWIMETSPRNNPWTAQRIVYELLAIWFGSVHAMSTTITFAIHDLCLHPEYLDPLRRELKSAQYAAFERTVQGLPLLDSFIKESTRLTPLESMSTRRHALQPFVLSDGIQLNVRDWACTPIGAMMRDPDHYPKPLQFRGFRFVDEKVLESAGLLRFKSLQPSPSTLTDNYDCHLVDKDAPRWFVWRSSMLPMEKTRVGFRPRRRQ
ncbi:hypothetical protein VTN96DRAFT_349 [Rasamsonia emersonii]